MRRINNGKANQILGRPVDCESSCGSLHNEPDSDSKAFQNKGQKCIQRNTKRPSSERRFKCEECERMFFTRKDVKRHMVVHTGVRNFPCPYCQQRFGRKDHLVRHAKKSHNRDTRTSSIVSGCRRTGSIISGHNMPSMNNYSPTIQPHSPPLAITASESPPCINYHPNAQTSASDQPSLLLLGSNNGHNSNCSGFPSNHALSSLHDGHYNVTGMQSGECMLANSGHLLKPNCDLASISGGPPYFPPHHFTGSSSNFMGPTYLHGSNNGFSNGPHGHPHCVPILVHREHASVSNATGNIPAFSAAEINSSLPHFSQAFQWNKSSSIS